MSKVNEAAITNKRKLVFHFVDFASYLCLTLSLIKMSQKVINEIKNVVSQRLANAEAGHDWLHIERVFHNAEVILADEPDADGNVVRLAALLHDIADAKFHNGDEAIGILTARKIMGDYNIDISVVDKVSLIIENMSFRKSLGGTQKYNSLELDIVRDADRLDAIGAIGIARTFAYGAHKGSRFYSENDGFRNLDAETYKSGNSSTIQHFYDKLLLLKDLFVTRKGKEIAEDRHSFLTLFLAQFYAEIGK
jgi:uncharacterized protein